MRVSQKRLDSAGWETREIRTGPESWLLEAEEREGGRKIETHLVLDMALVDLVPEVEIRELELAWARLAEKVLGG